MTIKIEDITPPPVERTLRLTIEMTEEEARVLYEVALHIGGDLDGARRMFERLKAALIEAEVGGSPKRHAIDSHGGIIVSLYR